MTKTPKKRPSTGHRFYVDCEKHGHHWALPVAKSVVLKPEDYPPNVEELHRICAMCLAEAMVSPVRWAICPVKVPSLSEVLLA
jgi:hypothetical protein